MAPRFLGIALGLVFLTSPQAARGDVTLPKIFGSNMVLQQEQPIKIWGGGYGW